MGRRGGGVVVAQVDACAILQEVLNADDLQRRFIDDPFRYKRTLLTMRPGNACGMYDLVVQQQRKRTIAVVISSHTVRDAYHAVPTDRITNRQNRSELNVRVA